jgi:hypothetical protein
LGSRNRLIVSLPRRSSFCTLHTTRNHGSWRRRERDVNTSPLTEEAARLGVAIREEPEVHPGLFSEEIYQLTKPRAIRRHNSQEDTDIDTGHASLRQTVCCYHSGPQQRRTRLLQPDQAGARVYIGKEQGEWFVFDYRTTRYGN